MDSRPEGGSLEQKGVEFVLGQSLSGKDAEPMSTSSELDDGRMTMDCLYRGGTADSEQETSDIEDTPLQNAGVWTEEEAARLTKEKLVRLQGLYSNQFKRLRHLLQLRYRHYHRELDQARRAATYNLGKPIPRYFIPKRQSQAIRHYKRRSGVEKLLYQLSRERRTAAAYGEEAMSSVAVRKSQAANHSQQCIFKDGDKQCVDTSMPFSKYCHKHICSDPNQLLYTCCSHQSASGSCNLPVLRCHSSLDCFLHCRLPPAITSQAVVHKTIQVADHLCNQEKTHEAVANDKKAEQPSMSFRKYLHLDLCTDPTSPMPIDLSSNKKKDGNIIEECLKGVHVDVESEAVEHSQSSGSPVRVKLQARTIAQLTNEQLQRAYEEQGVVIGSREGSELRDENMPIIQEEAEVSTPTDKEQRQVANKPVDDSGEKDTAEDSKQAMN